MSKKWLRPLSREKGFPVFADQRSSKTARNRFCKQNRLPATPAKPGYTITVLRTASYYDFFDSLRLPPQRELSAVRLTEDMLFAEVPYHIFLPYLPLLTFSSMQTAVQSREWSCASPSFPHSPSRALSPPAAGPLCLSSAWPAYSGSSWDRLSGRSSRWFLH